MYEWLAGKKLLREQKKTTREIDKISFLGKSHWFTRCDVALRVESNGHWFCFQGFQRAGYQFWSFYLETGNRSLHIDIRQLSVKLNEKNSSILQRKVVDSSNFMLLNWQRTFAAIMTGGKSTHKAHHYKFKIWILTCKCSRGPFYLGYSHRGFDLVQELIFEKPVKLT